MFTMQRRLPSILWGPPPAGEDCRINNNAPHAPIKTPVAFLPVMGSFRNAAAMSITMTGVMAAMREMLTGEVYCRATANDSCAPISPKRAAKNSIAKSLTLTFSRGINREIHQKMTVALDILTSVRANGLIHSGTSVLAIGVFSPKITLVISIAMCPCHFSLVIVNRN